MPTETLHGRETENVSGIIPGNRAGSFADAANMRLVTLTDSDLSAFVGAEKMASDVLAAEAKRSSPKRFFDRPVHVMGRWGAGKRAHSGPLGVGHKWSPTAPSGALVPASAIARPDLGREKTRDFGTVERGTESRLEH